MGGRVVDPMHVYRSDEHNEKVARQWRDLPDDALARHVADGSTTALGMLYERYGATLYRLTQRLLNSPADAEDVLHDVFLGLHRAIRTFNGQGTLERWLHKVAMRTALMRLRYQRNQRRLCTVLERESLHAMDGRSLADRISFNDALGTLPPTARAVISLKLEGYSHAEIGETLEISPSAAKQQFYRATQRLRQILEGR